MASTHIPILPAVPATELTKREFIAAVALQGILAQAYNPVYNAPTKLESAVQDAVKFADALLSELQKTQQ